MRRHQKQVKLNTQTNRPFQMLAQSKQIKKRNNQRVGGRQQIAGGGGGGNGVRRGGPRRPNFGPNATQKRFGFNRYFTIDSHHFRIFLRRLILHKLIKQTKSTERKQFKWKRQSI
jgi:hypothetical protein